MLRLGHIVYSNCFPVHARFIDQAPPAGVTLTHGVPSRLNELLGRGEIDVAPCSSIEYARHAGSYRLMPEVVIGAAGAVRSILLIGAHPSTVEKRVVALPTASATSVVLLKILLQVRWRTSPRFIWFDQVRDDPFAMGAAAALYIGDLALDPHLHAGAETRLDLGAEWHAETGLPFAFALWQTRGGSHDEFRALAEALVDSRAYWRANARDLAARYAAGFGIEPATLDAYWRGLQFDLDAPMLEGVRTFYRFARDIGEIARVPSLAWV